MKFSEIQPIYNPRTQGAYFEMQDLPFYIEKWSKDGLEVEPEFQRGHVWSESQQSKYIENLLRDGMSGRTVFINRGRWGKWRKGATRREGYWPYVLVDGLQRITSITRFMMGEIPAFGTFLHEFEDRIPSHAGIYIVFGELHSLGDVVQWYLDLNSGGVVHTDEEIDRVRKMLDRVRQEGQ